MLLPDSGHLQEYEAERANRRGYTRHDPALPLYTRADAENSLESLTSVPFGETRDLGGAQLRFRLAGHILGAATVEYATPRVRLVFSGDLGRPSDPLMYDPEPVTEADYLVVESTYGDRTHPDTDPAGILAEHVRRTAARGGVVVIPSFAVGRAQTLLYHLKTLRERDEIPHIPTFLDSPMAADATALYRAHTDEHRLSPGESAEAFRSATITNTVDESKAIDRRSGPMIVVSASGMATGGRVLFHLARFAPDPRNLILFAGHQAAGTRGAAILDGARSVRIHGHDIPIGAEVASIAGLSAHADAKEIMDWLGHFRAPPKRTFVTHGEPAAADALRFRIQDELGWDVVVPEHGERAVLE